jgi:hypothetical protein
MPPSHFVRAAAPPRRRIRASAWATLAHVAFQVGSVAVAAVAAGGRAHGWSAATVAQGAVAALLGVGAFRRNIVALTALALAGGVRAMFLTGTIARVSAGAADAASPRLILELAVTTPVALLWIAGGVSALRTLRRGAVSGREHG